MVRLPLGMRWLALDGALLGFDRKTGRNCLMRGPETAHLVQKAPRVMQLSLTNSCNKSCGFCYRPPEAQSLWTIDSTVEFARFISDWGVLELALGGGEPTVFPRFPELIDRLWRETDLAISFTTNGTRLSEELLDSVEGKVGQIQVSVYEDEDLDVIIERLVRRKIRFGLNYLVTPKRLQTLDLDILRFAEKGVRDVLLLSYKGSEQLHLNPAELVSLDQRIVRLHELLKDKLQLKVDVCWSSRLPLSPQLFYDDDCRAGSVFLSITSDRKVLSCSFADGSIPFTELSELPTIYSELKAAKSPAYKAGCGRLVNFGVDRIATHHPLPLYPEAR